jgi:hypothetical protein
MRETIRRQHKALSTEDGYLYAQPRPLESLSAAGGTGANPAAFPPDTE